MSFSMSILTLLTPASRRRLYRVPNMYSTHAEQSVGLLTPDQDRGSRYTSYRSFNLPSFGGFPHVSSILPGFLRPSGQKRKKITSTSYLDGIRGLAACIVVTSHAKGACGLQDVWILEQPIIGINHAGQAMVDVFFIISGYVLSYRMLKLMRNHDSQKLLDSLASSIFKRFLRLHLPVGLATFISMVLIRLNWLPNPPTERLPSFAAQFVDWFGDLLWSANPCTDVRGYWYEGVFRTRYLDQMWTVPVEFRGSMILFSYCAACCKLSDRNRIQLTFLTIVLFFYWQSVYAAMFLGGMLIADMSLSSMEKEQETSTAIDDIGNEDKDKAACTEKSQSLLVRIGWVILLILGIFCLSQPHPLVESVPFPWDYTRKIIPPWWVRDGDYDGKEHFLYGIGALSFIFAVESYPALQVTFNTPFLQHLGEISFGMYATHNMLIWMLADPILGPYRIQHFGKSPWGFLSVLVPIMLLTFWMGDYFTRANRHVINIGVQAQKRLFAD